MARKDMTGFLGSAMRMITEKRTGQRVGDRYMLKKTMELGRQRNIWIDTEHMKQTVILYVTL